MEFIDNKLYKEIEKYCKLNNIEDVHQEINQILQIGFNIVRFGVSPFQRGVPSEQLEQVEKNGTEVPPKKVRKAKIPKKKDEDGTEVEKKENVITEIPKKKVRIIKNK